MSFRIAAVLTVMLVPATARAQGDRPQAPIDSGAYVRARIARGSVTGRLLVRYTPGDPTLTLCRAYPGSACRNVPDDPDRRTLASRDVLRLEVQRGTHARTGAIFGGAVGVVSGGFLGWIVGMVCDAADCRSVFVSTLEGGVIGGLFFGGLGALVGMAFPRWVAP